MSEYQRLKEEAQRIQREKEARFKQEQEERATRDRLKAKAEQEKKKQRDLEAQEARRRELLKANDSLNVGNGSKANGGEYDLFAEDERPKAKTPTNSVVQFANKTLPKSTAPPKAGSSKPRSSISREPAASNSKANGQSSIPKRNGASPPPLGRKEKAAKAFAQSALKSTKSDSIFSIRSLVESRDGPSASGSLSPRPKIASSRPSASSIGKNTVGRNGIEIGNPNYRKGGGLKDQLNKSLKGEGMRKLCPDRVTRDRRTIDEIQKDIKSRKAASNLAAATPPASKPKPKYTPLPSTARPPSKRRSRSPSSSSTSSYESDRPKKKRKDQERDYGEPSQADISAQIQAMFRRPGGAPRKYVDEFSDEESDMEAGLSDIEQEDKRTAAIARREDLLAEEEEKARKLAKERAKREKLKGK